MLHCKEGKYLLTLIENNEHIAIRIKQNILNYFEGILEKLESKKKYINV